MCLHAWNCSQVLTRLDVHVCLLMTCSGLKW